MASVSASQGAARRRRRVGRFEMHSEIASGGFATIHLGRSLGPASFSKTVAIKRLHRQYARNREVRAMFLDEARVVARIQHPNVVPTLDLIEEDDELFLVMEYVSGVTLAHLLDRMKERKERLPVAILLRIMYGALEGLHAAHEAVDEQGNPMSVIHRDVSPDNIIVGVDGHARLLDFGVARAMGQNYSTREGEVKGKLSYLSPEQVKGEPLNQQTDIFSAAVVLWQGLTGKKLFKGRHFAELINNIASAHIEPPSSVVPGIPFPIDDVVLGGLERDRSKRWATAAKMSESLETIGGMAPSREVGRWVREVAAGRLAERAADVNAVENTPFATQVSETEPDEAPTELLEISGSRPVERQEIEDEAPERPSGVSRRATPTGIDDEPADDDAPADEQAAPPTPVPTVDPEPEPASAPPSAPEPAPAEADDAPAGEPGPDDEPELAIPLRTGRSTWIFVVLGGMAFLAILGALAHSVWQDRARHSAPEGSATASVATSAPSETVDPAATGPTATSDPVPSSDAATPTSSAEPGATVTVPHTVPTQTRPHEFTPGGI